ncbi:DNA polymerase beta superfamily protein [Deinococcus lacus]|uniref:DNA polymerase beta superfamily protein n=1 Tax=Deinococcus lacus TaxID=392561 RepID=A0ABW1YDE9_9DEIO
MLTIEVLGQPAQDNALWVQADNGQGITRLLLDCGAATVSGLPMAEIQQIDHLLLSHLHIDHIAGFDDFFRVNFDRRTKENHIWGPPETARILGHRFQGFWWNHAPDHRASWLVHEVGAEEIRTFRFEAGEAFAHAHPVGTRQREDCLIETPQLRVDALNLQHHGTSLGFLLREPERANVSAAKMRELGLKGGPWLAQLKAGEAATVQVGEQVWDAQELRQRLLEVSPGESAAYLTDFLLNDTELARLAPSCKALKRFIWKRSTPPKTLNWRAKTTTPLSRRVRGWRRRLEWGAWCCCTCPAAIPKPTGGGCWPQHRPFSRQPAFPRIGPRKGGPMTSYPPQLTEAVQDHPYPLLFATISGAHLYGFPSPDSDWDLRGAHILPLPEVLGLDEPNETHELTRDDGEVELDLVTHDLRKFAALLLRRNGYVLEQLLSPLIVHTTPAHAELCALAPQLVTRHHVYHYLGFTNKQWALLEKEEQPRVKPLLYAFRTVLTGIHLMRTGEVQANLERLNAEAKLPYLTDLMELKRGGREKEPLPGPLDFYRAEHGRLLAELEGLKDTTHLQHEVPAEVRRAVSDLVVRVRLGAVRGLAQRRQQPLTHGL